MHEVYVTFVEHGNTPLLAMPFWVSQVAEMTLRHKWRAEARRWKEEKSKLDKRSMMSKAGIPV